jgi:hypothetical protein
MSSFKSLKRYALSVFTKEGRKKGRKDGRDCKGIRAKKRRGERIVWNNPNQIFFRLLILNFRRQKIWHFKA